MQLGAGAITLALRHQTRSKRRASERLKAANGRKVLPLAVRSRDGGRSHG